MYLLSDRASAALHDFVHSQTRELSVERSSTTLADPEVEVVFDSLPGRAVVAMARVRGKLWIAIDPSKPDAAVQLAALVDNWPLDYPATTIRLPAPRAAGRPVPVG